MFSKFKNIYHYALAWLGSIIYRHPSRELYVIGVTGTKGKTTTVELLHAVLQNSGYRTALLSSAHLKFADEVRKNPKSNTMPGRFFIQKFLRDAVSKRCTHAVFEVTSQGVVQSRHRFIDFDAAAITCLHPEHIESHGGFPQYRGAKTQFFKDVASLSDKPNKFFFINAEMASGGNAQYFEDAVRHPTGIGHFGTVIYYNAENFVRNELGGDVTRVSQWLQSDVNLENAALVYAIARSLGISAASILKTFADFTGVPGRMEFISGEKTAVIDYALTPESLRALYVHLKKILTQRGGRLIGVFGSAGGGRDTWKRPALGTIAEEFCDHMYLTTDDSYDEDPQKIIQDIAAGISNKHTYTVVLDRRAAITQALARAGKNDIVAITGMGSQTNTYGPRGKKIPWSDKEVVEEVLQL